MTDKSWLLNPSAIRVAKRCIKCVQEELGVKLRLSHPDFLQMLHEYVDLTDSPEMAEAYSELLGFVGVGSVIHNLRKKDAEENIIPIPQKSVVNGEPVVETATEEMVAYGGKYYPKFNEGKTFKGLYRGRPHYI